MATVTDRRPRVGAMLRDWRRRRRLSQLDLALAADVSARHLSFVETGRARPSAELVLQLAERLEVPLRARNQLLLAAGYAPVYGQHALDAPQMAPVRDAIERVLAGHEPFPALVVDRHWGLVAANRAVGLLTAGVARRHRLARRRVGEHVADPQQADPPEQRREAELEHPVAEDRGGRQVERRAVGDEHPDQAALG